MSPHPNIEDRDIDFSRTLVIGRLGTDEAWNELFLFPPWIERIPHSAPFSSERQPES